jgi:membrane protease YdiL (CAAX protease family)
MGNLSEPGAAVVILSTLIFYYTYYYFKTSNLPEKFCSSILQPAHKLVAVFLVEKSSGFLILGVIPGLLYYLFFNKDFEKFGFSTEHFNENIYVIFVLVGAITTILFLNQKINKLNNTVQIKLAEWNLLLFFVNAFGWIIYLSAYEFLFRGILLFECYHSFGFWPAVAINVTIYSAIHMVNGKAQAIGALIFGGIACYLTLSVGSLLIPILMHVSLSIISDYFSIRYNVGLNFIKQTGFNLPQK